MSLRTQILIAAAALGAGWLAACAAIELPRARRQVEAEAVERTRAALVPWSQWLARTSSRGEPIDAGFVETSLGTLPGYRHAALVGPAGRVITATSEELRGMAVEELPLEGLADLAAEAAQRDEPRIEALAAGTVVAAVPLHRHAVTQDPRLIGPAVPGEPLGAPELLVAEVDLSPFLEAARRRVQRELAVAAGVGLGLLILAWLVLELRLVRRARRLAQALERFGAGDRAARAAFGGADEIGAIAAAFDRAAGQVTESEAQLAQARTWFEASLQALPAAVIVVSRADGRPWFVNERWRRLYGGSLDTHRDILSILSAVRCERPDGALYPLELLAIPTVLRTGRAARIDDLRLRRDDGSVAALTVEAVPLHLSGEAGFDAVLAIARERHVAIDAPGTPSTAARAPERPAATSRRPETVLVVEDEVALGELARQALAAAGYRVLIAADGDEALAIYRRSPDLIDAVVLDLTLPDKPGRLVLDEVLALDRDARVIVASGYHPDMRAITTSGRAAALLAKPYSAQRLEAVVRKVLERGRSAFANAPSDPEPGRPPGSIPASRSP